MPLIDCHFFSDTLRLSCSMYVVLPRAASGAQIGMTETSRGPGAKRPVLYLLHGLSDDHTIWLRRTSIERYATERGLAVVMPAVARSYYTDMMLGLPYFKFVSEELPAIVQDLFPISDQREDNFVAGLSMGGYGAMKVAMTFPHRFAAAASLSGAVDAVRVVREITTDRVAEFQAVFGSFDQIAGSPNDLFHLADKLAALPSDQRPLLYQCCGTEDFLYQDNLKFRDHLRKLSLTLTYEDGPGLHDWAYWDKMIQNVLAWLPLRKP
ncbi:MAG: esterase family protein [Phycisphaeraceae bacterium]|nr:esterase family protein [Phycisphaeraceae bacterium]